MGQMAEALRGAGLKTARERLNDIALRAMIKHADNRPAAEQEIWDAVRNSTLLMQELFKTDYELRVQLLVDHVQTMAAIAHDAITDPRLPEPPRKPKGPVALERWKAEREEERREQEARLAAVKPLERRAAPVAKIWEERDRVELKRRQDAFEEEARKQRDISYRAWCDRCGYVLDENGSAVIPTPSAAFAVTVNGKPFWEVSSNEARAWATKTTREAWFIESVIEGLPNDGRPIEYYRKPDEIEALWERSKC